MRPAAQHQFGAGGDRVLHQFVHVLQGLPVDERADFHPLLQPVAHPQSLHRPDELVCKGVLHPALHQEAVGADAGLAGVAILARHGADHGRIQIGIVEHQEGRVAAQFHGHPLDCGGALGDQLFAHRGRAGEGKLGDLGTFGEHPAHAAGIATGDDVDYTRREAGHLRQPGQRQGGQRRLRGRPEDEGAAHRQGRGGLAGDHGTGEIPGRDCSHHAHRLLDHDDAPVRRGRGDGLAVHPLAFLGEPFHERGAVGDLAPGLGQGLALFHGHDQAEFVLVRHDQLEPAAQQPAAVGRGARPPVGQGPRGRVDGPLGQLRTAVRHPGDDLAIGRIAHLEAVLRGHPGAIDVAVDLEQGTGG